MKVVLERNTFLETLAIAGNVVEKKNTMPILGHVLLTAESNGLSIKATDLDISYVDAIPSKVEGSGKVAVPAHLLLDIVRKFPEAELITLEQNGNQLIVTSGASRFNLAVLDGGDFPSIGSGEDFPVRFSLKAWELRYLVDKTRFAMSTEETRYNLNGICLHVVEHQDSLVLRAAATDSHRLACAHISMPSGAEKMPSIIIARKTVLELSKFLERYEGDVSISLSSFQICLRMGNALISSRLIDGTFPDYERLIPYENDNILIADRKAFLEAVDRVSLISFDRMRPIKMRIQADQLELSAPNSEFGSAKETLGVSYGHDPIDIGFNSRYLMDLSQLSDSDKIEIRLKDSSTAALVCDAGDASSLTVLMPMRV